MRFCFLYISRSFMFFRWHEMTCFAVVLTKWALDDKSSILSSYLQTARTNLMPGELVTHFACVAIWNNRKMIAETRSDIFRWPSPSCLLKLPIRLERALIFATTSTRKYKRVWLKIDIDSRFKRKRHLKKRTIYIHILGQQRFRHFISCRWNYALAWSRFE